MCGVEVLTTVKAPQVDLFHQVVSGMTRIGRQLKCVAEVSWQSNLAEVIKLFINHLIQCLAENNKILFINRPIKPWQASSPNKKYKYTVQSAYMDIHWE